jgi:hypothetical protein
LKASEKKWYDEANMKDIEKEMRRQGFGVEFERRARLARYMARGFTWACRIVVLSVALYCTYRADEWSIHGEEKGMKMIASSRLRIDGFHVKQLYGGEEDCRGRAQ